MNRKPLTKLQMAHFWHPTDDAAQAALVRNISNLKPEAYSIIANYEAFLYARQISSSLLVAEDQLPELHLLLSEACEILDVPQPLFFVENNSAINAWASGSNTTLLVVTSGLVETFNQEEILAVIGHELGHIKGQHMYYRALAENAQSILAIQAGDAASLQASADWTLSTIGMFAGASVSEAIARLEVSLLEWSRAAEFTADRASLLVTQDLSVTINVMAKLASGLNRQFNHEAFIRQAERFRTFGSAAGDYYRQMLMNQDTHPLIVLRAEELRNWASSEVYRNLTNPEQPVAELSFFCPGCSQKLIAPIALTGQTIQCPTCQRSIIMPTTGLPPIDCERQPPKLPPPLPPPFQT